MQETPAPSNESVLQASFNTKREEPYLCERSWIAATLADGALARVINTNNSNAYLGKEYFLEDIGGSNVDPIPSLIAFDHFGHSILSMTLARSS